MRIRRIFPAVALALTLGLAGCGSDGDSDPTSDDTAVPTDEATTDDESMDDDKEMDDEESMDDEEKMDDKEMDDEESTGDDAEASGPDFTGTTVGGEPFDGASLAGQPAVLWFWAPWCPKCMAQAPAVLDIAAEHEGDIEIVGVAGLAAAEDMPEFIDSTGTGELTHLSDPDGEIWRKYDIAEQSTFVFLDATGEPVNSGSFSDADLADEVAKLG